MISGPLPGDDLAAMFHLAWQRLEDAVVDPDSPLRWLVVATNGEHGPSARLMVLRDVDRGSRTLFFYTDRRAVKVGEIAADPRVAITAYDPALRLQLRLNGVGRLAIGSAGTRRWQAIGDSGRQAYATSLPPGSRLVEPGSGLPPEIVPADFEANFAVLAVVVNRLEWLWLAAAGHRRARYCHRDGAWTGSWRVP